MALYKARRIFREGEAEWSGDYKRQITIAVWRNGAGEWGHAGIAGKRVSPWCGEQGIAVSTYYNWQRKVYQAVSSESEIYFAELPIRPTKADTAASIQCGELRVDIHAGTDGETIHAIIQALKSC